MTAVEIAEWRAYCEIEPFGQDRQDAGSAIVAHTIAMAVGGEDTLTPADFLPRFGGETKRRVQSGEEMLAKARAFAERFKTHKGGDK
jgi:hypothetical protein